jgi:vacuolar protein 8
LRALVNLSALDGNHEGFAIQILRQMPTLLLHTSTCIQQAAAALLSNLLIRIVNHKLLLRAAEAIVPKLCLMMMSENVGVRQHSSGALANLAASSRGRSAIVTAEGVPGLLKLLRSTSVPAVLENTAEALLNLSQDKTTRATIRSSGAVGALQRLVSSEDRSVREMAEAAQRVIIREG